MKISESKKTNLAVICAENKENAIALAAFIQGLPDETAQQNKEMRRLQILYRTCYVSSVLLWLIADRTYFSGMMTFVSVISGLCGFGFHGGSDEIKEHRDLYHAVKGELVSLSQSQQTLFGGSISMPAKQVVEANSRSFNLPCVIL